MYSDILKKKEEILCRIEAAKQKGGYTHDVTLVAVTKYHTIEETNDAIRAGIDQIGENHVQALLQKDPLLLDCKRNFIGHLQTNKVKYLIGKTDLIQSLDREELAEELQKRAEKAGWTAECLVEINAGSELSKSGFFPEQAAEAVQKLAAYPNIRLRGLMAMLPICENTQHLRSLCLSIREIYDTIKKERKAFDVLSMGMSGDWRLCVECGSNMIRLGTALFGERHYPAKA